jgi:hypothetical protein
MFYATLDFDGDTIAEDATIFAYATLEEAESYLKSSYSSDEWRVSIEDGRFSDCWIKAYDKPTAVSDYLAPFDLNDLIIQAPGQHPGGHGYWITPRADILVAVLEPID